MGAVPDTALRGCRRAWQSIAIHPGRRDIRASLNRNDEFLFFMPAPIPLRPPTTT